MRNVGRLGSRRVVTFVLMPGGSIRSIGRENFRSRGWRGCACRCLAGLCWTGGIFRQRPVTKLALTLSPARGGRR